MGYKVNLSTTFHPQIDSRAEHILQNMVDMLRACVIDSKSNRDDHLPLINFVNIEIYHSRIQMSFHEDLYGRRCICYIVWFDVGEFGFIGQDLFHQAMEKFKVTQ